MSALPMPRNEKLTSISQKLSPKMGSSSDTTVTSKESSTVFFRPNLFISTPVGTENSRNQKKTSEGKIFAVASLSPRSFLT